MHLLEVEEMVVEFSEAADRDVVSMLLRQSLWIDVMRDNSVLTLILSVTRLREVLWGQTSDSCDKKAGHFKQKKDLFPSVTKCCLCFNLTRSTQRCHNIRLKTYLQHKEM